MDNYTHGDVPGLSLYVKHQLHTYLLLAVREYGALDEAEADAGGWRVLMEIGDYVFFVQKDDNGRKWQ